MVGLDRGWIKSFLDGSERSDTLYTNNVRYYFIGELRLGYYEKDDGTAHYFQGSLGVIDVLNSCVDSTNVWNSIMRHCPAKDTGYLVYRVWDGIQLARPLLDCASRGMPNFFSNMFVSRL